ncbi:MAG TPA: 7-cyano-7-deazaguanine synthase QueC [Thermoplasmata archaeon]
MPEAIVLLSGGLDSSTVLGMAKKKGFEVVAITFDYGQRHRRELDSAKKVAQRMGVKEHLMIPLDIGRYLKSALTSKKMELPVGRPRKKIGSGIPSTYVPSRNLVFLSIATALAESRGAEAVFIAANAVDFSGYPDCTPEFIRSFQRTVTVGTRSGREGRPVRIEAPLLSKKKADIVREAVRLGVPLELTWSCYKGGKKACGRCDSCQLRLEGFAQAGHKDPLSYEVRA